MSKRLIIILALIACLLLGSFILIQARRKPQQSPEYVFFYAENQLPDYPTTLGAEYFAKLVEEQSDGRIHILVQSEAKMGSESEVLKQIQYGGIGFARISLSQIAEQIPELNVLQLPYLYSDSEHMWRVLDGEIGDDFLQQIEEYGYVGLSWYDAGSRNFYSTNKPITCLEDFQGMTIRVQESDMMVSMVEALGARAVKLEYANVYSGLQQGIVDGAENNWPSYEAMNHYEVAPFYTEDEHTRVPEIQICSAYVWNMLSEEDRRIIRDCATKSALYERQLWREREAASKQKALERGVEVITLSPEEKERFRRAMEDVYQKYGADSKDLIQKIVAE